MPEPSDWREVTLELLGTWPGRFDEMTAAAYVRVLIARGADDPAAVLQALRSVSEPHPPSAGELASLAKRAGQAEPPAFEEVAAFIARTLASHTRYGDDALAAYVAFVAAECHEAAARWVAQVGIPALRQMPDARYALDNSHRARLRDHERGYREQAEGWRANPARGVALETAIHVDRMAGREVPEALRQVRDVPQIEGGR